MDLHNFYRKGQSGQIQKKKLRSEDAEGSKRKSGQVPEKLLQRIDQDLESDFPSANAVCGEERDRGAMRSLVWSEKVTLILRSLLARYEKEGDAMLENSGVWVCTICGFVYVGNALPEVCPVCAHTQSYFEVNAENY